MVLAWNPVVSVKRLAARPVGAQSRMLTLLADRIRRIEFTIVVLPTPGPPVMTRTFDSSDRRIAAIWALAKASAVFCSIQGNAFAGSMKGQGMVPSTRR